MPFIIKNGKYYGSGGGSGDSSIDITQAEYDKLEASGKVNHDVTYYITDGVYEEGEGNTNIVKLSQVEYDALGDEKLSDNNIYLITDADELTAKNLSFDDSETGLGVNNVQDAIVEQNKKIPTLKKVRFEIPDVSVSANYLNSIDIDISASTGTPIAIAGIILNTVHLRIYGFYISNSSTAVVSLYNTTTTDQKLTDGYVDIIFVE